MLPDRLRPAAELITGFLLVGWLFGTSGQPLAAQPPDFDREIAPLLASRCLDCHRGAEPKGGLDLSHEMSARNGGESGPGIVPGKFDESPVWTRVEADEMPPKRPLSAAEKSLLKRWIDNGAAWGTSPIDPFRFTTDSRAGYDWWSFRPVKPSEPPPVRANRTIRNAIDQFVLARLDQAGIEPSPEADRRTLARRLYFDLVGLPPTPEEVEAFERDPSPQAYEALVDRLLESPHYGERWARHWLDVVRYGESDGFERNGRRANSWYYRDWLIRAFNENMRYDRFCQLQLAGDVLEPGDPEARHATGFLVAGVHNTVLGNDMMRAIARQDELEDIIGNVGQVLLGLTTNCGRCHDHKFDPVSQQDYYRLAATLAGVQHGEQEITRPWIAAQIAVLDSQIDRLKARIEALEGPVRRALLAERTGTPTSIEATPEPVAAWDLREGLSDQRGKADLIPKGAVTRNSAGAHVSAGTYLRSLPLEMNLREKTLEAWVRLDRLEQSGGGIISLQTPDGQVFDAIVFAEREPAKWMAGSNGFTRTQPFEGPAETEAADQPVQFVIAYDADGTIRGYRNGVAYGKPYRSSGPQPFAAGQAVVLLGCRHEPPGGNRMVDATIVQARIYHRALTPQEIETLAQLRGVLVPESAVLAKLEPAQREQHGRWKHELTNLQAARAKLEPEARYKAYVARSQQPPETRLLRRGDLASPGEVLRPGVIAAFSHGTPEFDLAKEASEGVGRQRLADWITSPENPLFSRVIVNRLWHHHFGLGLVETPSDFGFNGGRPSHPELLDWLASELVRQQFRLKPIHKLIVCSATYRQSSTPRTEALAKDADNRLLWRRRPLRVEAEVLRDEMLSVAGLLNRELGGPAFSDYRIIDAMNGTAYYEPYDPVGPEFHRRSIYRFLPRGGNQGMLDLFDCPDPAASAPRRNATTTPLQALTLWNGPFSLRMAASLADRVRGEVPEDVDQQIERAYQFALQRRPSDSELARSRPVVKTHGLKALGRVLLNSNEFLTVE